MAVGGDSEATGGERRAEPTREQRGGKQRIPRPENFRPGRPAPWGSLDPARRRFTLDEVRARLALYPPVAGPIPWSENATAAAVLVPLFESDGEVSVVLTRRPETMPSHQGEIAFPGGKHDAAVDTDLRATALREAQEEIGLDPASVEIVARLEGLPTAAGAFTIAPFVGFIADEPELVPDPREVARVFSVPLSELMAEDVFREEVWDTWRMDLDIQFYELVDETVWGATARILTGFLAHLVTGR